jgi:sialic acid synthase SpsE
VFVIAEIGKGFIQTEEDKTVEEYLENAKILVRAASEAGVDAVKFQTHELEDEFLNVNVTSPHFQARGSDRYTWIKRNMNATPLEEFWRPIKAYCEEMGVLFFSTPMSRKAAMKLNQLDVPPHLCDHSCRDHQPRSHGWTEEQSSPNAPAQGWRQDSKGQCLHCCGGVPLWKVGSGDVQDKVLLDYITQDKKPVIISTGMVSLDELDEVVKYITSKGSPLAVLYCISHYPAPPEYFNLGTIELLREKYPDVVVGFSDHSLGDEVALAAVKVGARVVEKHFTLDRGLWGSDHKVAMLPHEMRRMVETIRSGAHMDVDEAPYYGQKDKELEGAENLFRPYYNKSLMAGVDMPAGTIITKEMVFAMRPRMLAGGLPAEKFEDVIGRRVTADLRKYDPITEDCLE